MGTIERPSVEKLLKYCLKKQDESKALSATYETILPIATGDLIPILTQAIRDREQVENYERISESGESLGGELECREMLREAMEMAEKIHTICTVNSLLRSDVAPRADKLASDFLKRMEEK